MGIKNQEPKLLAWQEQLFDFFSKEDLNHIIKSLSELYINSYYANNQDHRQKTTFFINHLKNIPSPLEDSEK